MENVVRGLRTLAWFISQCANVGGLGAIYFWVFFATGASGLVFLYRSSARPSRRTLCWLLLLPALWLGMGFLGGFFWRDDNPPGPVVTQVLNIVMMLGLPVYLVLAVALVVWLPGGRRFATLFAAMNLYPMLGMTLLTAMAISGAWL